MRTKAKSRDYSHCVWCTECGSHHGVLYKCPTYDKNDLQAIEAEKMELLELAKTDPRAALIVKLFGIGLTRVK